MVLVVMVPVVGVEEGEEGEDEEVVVVQKYKSKNLDNGGDSWQIADNTCIYIAYHRHC